MRGRAGGRTGWAESNGDIVAAHGDGDGAVPGHAPVDPRPDHPGDGAYARYVALRALPERRWSTGWVHPDPI